MKTTNEWIIDDIIRPFEDWEMLILNIKQEIFKSLLLMSLHGQKTSLQELWRLWKSFKFSTCIFCMIKFELKANVLTGNGYQGK